VSPPPLSNLKNNKLLRSKGHMFSRNPLWSVRWHQLRFSVRDVHVLRALTTFSCPSGSHGAPTLASSSNGGMGLLPGQLLLQQLQQVGGGASSLQASRPTGPPPGFAIASDAALSGSGGPPVAAQERPSGASANGVTEATGSKTAKKKKVGKGKAQEEEVLALERQLDQAQREAQILESRLQQAQRRISLL
jgi:hypothetical protein